MNIVLYYIRPINKLDRLSTIVHTYFRDELILVVNVVSENYLPIVLDL